jgi:hypothetical protein
LATNNEVSGLICALFSFLFLIGCTQPDPIKKLETTCAESFKLSLKDPDSFSIVANLGIRGVSEDEGKGFWIRYKAKNSYGAFVSSNAYCRISSDGTAARFTSHEYLAVQKEENSLIDAQIKGLRGGKSSEEMNWGDTNILAKQNVFDSPDDLMLMKNYKP